MDKYTPPQIDRMLDSMAVCIDSREQDTLRLRKRIQDINKPCMRQALAYGDYTAIYTDADGKEQSLEKIAVIERKQNLVELCANFTKERQRFEREFQKALADGCHVHLLIENDNYETLFAGQYQPSKERKFGSKLSVEALTGSLLSWSIKYGMKVHFCQSETTGRLIREILHYELRNYLLNETEKEVC